MRTRKFVTQKPTHSVPLTMGGTSGIHPTNITSSNSIPLHKPIRYNVTEEQRKLLEILKDMETAGFGRDMIRNVLRDSTYRKFERNVLNRLREIHLTELTKEYKRRN